LSRDPGNRSALALAAYATRRPGHRGLARRARAALGRGRCRGGPAPGRLTWQGCAWPYATHRPASVPGYPPRHRGAQMEHAFCRNRSDRRVRPGPGKVGKWSTRKPGILRARPSQPRA